MAAGLGRIAREWGRIGCVGFGGPPAHLALLRELCVERERWLTEDQFRDGVAATQLLPGPGSTQMAILCAHRAGRGRRAAVVGGLAFIAPGLVVIIALAAVFLGSPPAWIRGAGMGAGAAVAAVALQQGLLLAGTAWTAAPERRRHRVAAYAAAGAVSAAALGAWVVLVLLACGLVELAWRRAPRPSSAAAVLPPPLPGVMAAAAGGLGALTWTAFKVGALAYGGGFVIVPLMQSDAVDRHGWMTGGEFLNAVALGQVTPGPVVHTVAVVGFAAAGVGGALLASAVAFAPSFAFVLLGADRFDRLLAREDVRAFVDGAGPAALGAIAGSAVPLALALADGWQWAVLAAAAVALLGLRRGVVEVLLAAGLTGALVVGPG
jgi:chromate transporter